MALQPGLTLLVLLSALLHAGWNALAKSRGDKLMVFAVTWTTGGILAAVALPLLAPMAPAGWPYAVASAAIHNGYFFFLMRAYENGDLGQVYPLARGTGPLLVAGLTATLAVEMPTPGGLAGILLVSAGIASLAFAGRRLPGDGKGMALALVTALFIAAYTLCDGLGVRAAGAPLTYAAWLFVLSAVPFVAATAVVRRRTLEPDLCAAWRSGVAAGALSLVAYAVVLYAMSRGAIAYVAALRETSVLFAALIGTLALGEPFGRRRIVAATVIAAGLVVLQTTG